MAKLNDIGKILEAKLRKGIAELPSQLGNEAVDWTKANFDRQGWPGASFEPWKKRKEGTKNDVGRSILILTGRLKRSIRLTSIASLRVSFGTTDVPYARAHNDGFIGLVNVKSHSRKKITRVAPVSGGKAKSTISGSTNVKSFQRKMNLPRRRFIGYSPVLQSILIKKAVVIVGRELKS